MGFVGVAPLALLLALGAIRGCTRGAVMIELNETAGGRPVTMEVGQLLKITLPQNGTTGYRWLVGGDCEPFLSLKGDQTRSAEGPPGAGGKRVWVFAAKTEGHCELRFEYARSWEKTVTGTILTFPITVRSGG